MWLGTQRKLNQIHRIGNCVVRIWFLIQGWVLSEDCKADKTDLGSDTTRNFPCDWVFAKRMAFKIAKHSAEITELWWVVLKTSFDVNICEPEITACNSRLGTISMDGWKMFHLGLTKFERCVFVGVVVDFLLLAGNTVIQKFYAMCISFYNVLVLLNLSVKILQKVRKDLRDKSSQMKVKPRKSQWILKMQLAGKKPF